MRNITISLILGALCSFTTQAMEAPCFRYEADIPLSSLDSRLGFTGNDMIRDFNNASRSVLLNWEDGTATSAHWEFTPAFDAAGIFIADYDDDCSLHVANLNVRGVLSLKTEDGRIDAVWSAHLSSLWGGIPSIGMNLSIEPQDLQGLVQPLEGEHELTHIWMGITNGQLDGAIFRGYRSEGIIENEDGSITLLPMYARGLAFMGRGLEVGFIWQKP